MNVPQQYKKHSSGEGFCKPFSVSRKPFFQFSTVKVKEALHYFTCFFSSFSQISSHFHIFVGFEAPAPGASGFQRCGLSVEGQL